MFRRCLRRMQMHGGPDFKDRAPHRFSEGTLAQGQHRITPGLSHRAWVDARSPFERAKQWLLDPMPTYITYGVIFLCFLGLYFNAMQARDTAWIQTNTNHLHRSLALESAKLENANIRLEQLDKELELLRKSKDVRGNAIPVPSLAATPTPGQSQHLEVQINREQKRNKELMSRVNNLVEELAEVRAEAHTLRAATRDLEHENKRLKTLLGRLEL